MPPEMMTMRHAQRRRGDDGGLDQHELDVAGVEEAVVAEDREEREDADEPDDRAELRGDGEPAGAGEC